MNDKMHIQLGEEKKNIIRRITSITAGNFEIFSAICLYNARSGIQWVISLYGLSRRWVYYGVIMAVQGFIPGLARIGRMIVSRSQL